MLMADYGKEGEADWRRVVYDPYAGTVTFYNCHQSKQFQAWGADQEFTCPVSELRAVYWSYVRTIGSVLTVVTTAGQARIPQNTVGLDGVRSALIGGLALESQLRWYESETAKIAIVIAFICGTGILMTLLIAKAGVLDNQWPVEFERTVLVIFCVIVFFPIWFSLVSKWRGKSLW